MYDAMNDIKSKKTSSVDATIADFITIHDLLKDSNRYFQNRIETKTNTTTYEDFDNLEHLYERTTDVMRLINDIIKKSEKELQNTTAQHTTSIGSESEENTSYLDMSVRKYECFDLKKSTGNLNRNDYVDVSGKISKECNDDDNIYDNYMVERNGKCPMAIRDAAITSHSNTSNVKNDVNDKKDCPFNGLPAAHLMIMQSPKVGWLTMHLRRKRFIRQFSINFKRKYYTGLVSRQTDKDYYEWWLLMYAGGTSDLKPTICLPLNQFEACADRLKATKTDDKSQNECKRNPCKFELNEKNKKKDANTYCFVAETPEHCEHWINLVKQLSIGLPYIESTFVTTAQIRKLPMPPLNVQNNDRLTGDIDTVDTNALSSTRSNIELDQTNDICNYSEGVYEEPEEYYKNVPTSIRTTAAAATTTTTTAIVTMTATSHMPKLPVKKALSQSTASTIRIDDMASIYDTPKKPVRKPDDAKHYDLISVGKDNESKTRVDSVLKIDDEIRSKLSTQLKEQSQKYLSSSSDRKTNDEEMVRNSSANGTPNKNQLSAMRKWLFSNHLAKLRQSTNSTNFMRKSSGSSTTDTTNTKEQQQEQQQQLSNQQPNKTTAIAPSSDAFKRSFSVQPKGNKVHMIINQLEANGQLTLLSGGGTSTPSKCSAVMSA